ncbi:MAG TPA: Holliday junction resolvase RuvX [Fimbriimonas sp.]|nr:Holliday junction resolvase RuvX [Fimbriimonas sp.]
MRLLGVDFGFQRIGLAVAESSPFAAATRPALQASGALKKDAEAIAALARKEEVDRIVVGMPLEPSGLEGRMAQICRKLAAHLVTLGLDVEVTDERLTSVEANHNLAEAGLKASRRNKIIDSESAILILERYLHEEEAATP